MLKGKDSRGNLLFVQVFLATKLALEQSKKQKEKVEAERIAKIEERKRVARQRELEKERQAEAEKALWSELKPVGVGSSFSISRKGYLITNHHVVEGCQGVIVHDKGQTRKATIVSSDKNNDLALLKANFKPSVTYSINPGNPKITQEVFLQVFH